MKKKLVTICAVMMMMMIIMKIFSVSDNKNNDISQSTVENNNEETNFPYKMSDKCEKVVYTSRIDEKQKIDMNTYAELGFLDNITKQGDYYGFKIVDVSVSRRLPDKFKLDEKYRWKRMDFLEDTYRDDEFTKDFYFLIVSVECTLLKEKTGNLHSSILHYMFVDGTDAYDTKDGQYSVNGQDFGNIPYYQYEDDDKGVIWYRGSDASNTFQKGTVCNYTACYIISDEMKDYNNIYLVANFGMDTGEIMKDKEHQKYLRIDIGQ